MLSTEEWNIIFVSTSCVQRVPIFPYSYQHLLFSIFITTTTTTNYYCHPSECDMGTHCGFDLHFLPIA